MWRRTCKHAPAGLVSISDSSPLNNSTLFCLKICEMGNQELQVSFDEVREKNVEQLKMLNNIVFPIKFPVSERRPMRAVCWVRSFRTLQS